MRIASLIRSPLFALVLLAMSAAAYAQISISVSFAPPELPVYEQPLCPGEGYLWTPGYWAYANDYDDYYWVPGTWVMAPEPGLLWTPAYWGWGGNGYVFYQGYWGHAGRLLWRNQLRLRILRPRLSRRTVAERTVLLQPFGKQRERHQHSQRLQHDRHQQYHHGEPGQLQRRQWWDQRAPEAGRRSCGT